MIYQIFLQAIKKLKNYFFKTKIKNQFKPKLQIVQIQIYFKLKKMFLKKIINIYN